ncbi:MAG: glycosyltransferase family 1 protein [Candidatus Dormiibacterota bacterium]
MSRIAVDGSGLARPRAGVGVYTREVLRAMASVRRADFLVYAPPGTPPPIDGGAVLTPPAARLLGRHLLWPRRLRRSGAACFFGCAGQLPLGGVGMPSVVTAHDLAIYRHPEWFPSGQWLSVRHVVPRSMRRAGVVACVSASTARDVAELFDVSRERLRVVHLGVDPVFAPQPPERIRELRARLHLPDRFVLFLSTIEPRKNLPTLFDAWARLRDRPPLVVAGAVGWRADDVVARLERAGSDVLRLGSVPFSDLPALCSAAACLAHPAWYEGFGLPPLEAMACGTPVVASDRSSLPEVLGDAALLVDPADVEGWSSALGRVLEDEALRATLVDRGRRRAAELTWARTAAGTWQAIDDAAAR